MEIYFERIFHKPDNCERSRSFFWFFENRRERGRTFDGGTRFRRGYFSRTFTAQPDRAHILLWRSPVIDYCRRRPCPPAPRHLRTRSTLCLRATLLLHSGSAADTVLRTPYRVHVHPVVKRARGGRCARLAFEPIVRSTVVLVTRRRR